MLKYDLILMDADNTLYDFDASEARAIREVLPEIGILAPDAPEVYSRLNLACWLDYNRGLITQEALRVRRFRDFLRHYGLDADPREVGEAYTEALSHQSLLLPGALEAVQAVAAHLPVAVVTNDFHVARARLIAQKKGYEATIGVGAPIPWLHLEVNYYLREAFAVVKSVLFD